MMKLSKFYDLIHKSATVTLSDSTTGKTIYTGMLKSIPDECDGYTVRDFHMNNDGEILFDIEREG